MTDYSQLRITELKALLQTLGLNTRGRKHELLQRLIEAKGTQQQKAKEASSPKPSPSRPSPSRPSPSQSTAPHHSLAMNKLSTPREQLTPSLIENEALKCAQRAQRFGTGSARTEQDKLAQRALRFGLDHSLSIDEKKKREERAKRFGLHTTESEMAKRQARALRFGNLPVLT